MAKDQSSTELAQSRTDWAEARTDWAEDRTIMANERTFAAWIRTGLACIVIALGLQAVFGSIEPKGLGKAVATVFLAAAIGVFWSARNRAKATLTRLHSRDCMPQSTKSYTILASALSLATLLTGVVLWLL
ncbi:putative membrane protein [Loktanella atrilutea]|uniref:Putative membrane protein n=1 Tax=Loktanella atrilutea TaxID=366533 RepID=A0A1M4XEN6_LOKAT|nr:DUF202 domain-containing protein [Loktanella atrilutea]SHE91632.1 putative membrane protein [Loktanella atrilutea]